MKQYHLISGTPRSGSTMFSAILNQNPRFHASASTMLYYLFEALYVQFAKCTHGFAISETKRKNILSGLFESYYQDVNKEVIFDTNRYWTTFKHAIPAIDPNMKYVCLVREIPLILNSFEKAFYKNPLHIGKIYDISPIHVTSEERCKYIFENKILQHVKFIREIINSPYKDNFLFLEYEYLCENPQEVMKNVYNFIEEPYFEHDFNNVQSEHYLMDLYDNAPNFHTTESVLTKRSPTIITPKEVLEKYNIGKYWIP